VSAQRVVRTIRSIARDEVGRHWHPALGVVTSMHGRNGDTAHACTVELRESGIVLPRVPIAVGVLGMAALPAENDLVVVAFANGDLHAPFVVGRLYNEEVSPPTHDRDEAVLSLPGGEDANEKRLEIRIKTPDDGTRDLHLLIDGSVKVELEVSDSGLRLQAQDARLELTQSSSSDGKAELVVGETSVVLEQGGDMSLEAAGTLKLKATKVEIAGDAAVKITGQTIDLN
jgi:phage baseplate assembly protein gpV